MSSRDLANLKQGLVAAWIPSLGSTGYRLVDRVGSNHGVLTNMDAGSDWVVSNNNLALDFDGSDDYVDTKQIEFARTASFTLTAWSLSRGVNNEQIINNENASYRGYQLSINPSAKLQFILRDTPTTSFIGVTSDDSLQTDRVYHLAAVYDGSSNASNVALYIDGVSVEKTVTGNNLTGSTLSGETTWIGRRRPISQGPFNGQLDDIRIYNRVLTPPEISLLSKERGIGFKTNSRTSSVFAKRYSYKPPKDKTYAAITRSQSDYDSLREGLVLAICPSVSGATGYRAVDLSGRGNHGTLTNMTPEDWVPSGGAGALDFENLSDDRVNYSSANISMAEGAISLWCRKVAATADDNDYMLWMHFTSVTDRLYLEIQTYLVGGNKNAKFLATFNNSLSNYAVGTTINLNQWYHAFVQWKNGFPIEIYIDGRFVSSSSTNYTTNATTTSEFIGNDHANLVGFGGYIDDFRRYTRRLTPGEIRLLASKRGIGLRSQKQTMFYQFPSGSKRRRILTGMP